MAATSSRSGPAARGSPIRAHYGYADGSGEYYLTIDTDRCDGCGDCVPACPRNVLEIALDDYDDPKAMVRPELSKTLADVCYGFTARCAGELENCHTACPHDAITHSW